MSRIFIDRPIFAWVLAIVVMLAGIGAIATLPVEQYPDVAPPVVNIRATYPGASAETVENSVTQIIEQQLTGIDGLLYFASSSSSRGAVNISVTFAKGTDPDIAQVQVQNQVQQALPRLPQPVQQQGVRVTKSNPDFLLIVAVYDATDQRTNRDVSDYLASNIQDPLSRVPGVGDINVFGAPHAMRIWLNPQRLAAFALMPSDVVSAIQTQNTEVAAGEVGGLPQGSDANADATVTAQSRLQTAAQFEQIILKTEPSGATVRMKDVARVELGADNYNAIIHVNRHPGAGIAVSLAPGADALETADLVKARVADLSREFPRRPRLRLRQRHHRLHQAVGARGREDAVRGGRPGRAGDLRVPAELAGDADSGDRHSGRPARHVRGVLRSPASRSTRMTLFGLTLAVGLLVDDAIVVVENVERLLEENPGMSPREATIQSMSEIQVALVAIALSLVGGVPADGVLRRLDRRHLQAILADHRLGDGPLGAGRADPEPGFDRRPCCGRRARGEAQPSALDRRLPAIARPIARRAGLVQPHLRRI